MKLILLAAAALIASPALAQTSGSTGTSSPTSSGGQGTATTSGAQDNTQGSGNTQPTTQSEQQSSMPMSSSSSTMPMSSTGGDPVGGYQPTSPAMQGQMQPGATVQFVPAQTPDQAYPAPAPLAKYPVCKKGQYDKCIQRGGR